MKQYELILERRQPSCGGRDPKDVKMMNVATDDPVEYVKQAEKTEQVNIIKNENGEIVIEVQLGARQVRYTFTED